MSNQYSKTHKFDDGTVLYVKTTQDRGIFIIGGRIKTRNLWTREEALELYKLLGESLGV